MCRYGPCTYLQARVCMRGGGLYICLLGCTCAPVAAGQGVGTPGSPRTRSTEGPRTIGGAGKGKLVEANPVTFSLHCSLGCPGSVLAIAGPRTLAAGGVRTQGGSPIQSSERGQTLATAGQDHSLPGLSQRPSDPLEVEEGIGPQTVCLPSCLGRGWHSSGGLFWTLPWALAEVGPPSPGPISACKQHGSPKGDMTLLPGVPLFSKQLLASSVCVCQVKRHLHSVTVLSGKELCLRQCILGLSIYWQEVRSPPYPS